MSNHQAGIKISPDEYFQRQKDAEETCRNKIKRLIIQFLFFIAAAIVSWFIYIYLLPSFFIFFGLIIFLCILMAAGSLLMIPKTIRYYKYSLERIVEYMLSGGIIIEIPKEDYEKFDLIKSKKDKFKQKSLNQIVKEEKKAELNKQKELEQKEYEKRVEEQFQKQYYSEMETKDE